VLVLDHSLDLPFTRTDVDVETRDGEVHRYRSVNRVPDLVRLVGGSILGVTGGALLYRYTVAVSDGDDALRSAWFWALPMGLVAGGVGAALTLTGWHPANDLVIDDAICPAAPAGLGRGEAYGPAPSYGGSTFSSRVNHSTTAASPPTGRFT
jgi:hypothetical protein